MILVLGNTSHRVCDPLSDRQRTAQTSLKLGERMVLEKSSLVRCPYFLRLENHRL